MPKERASDLSRRDSADFEVRAELSCEADAKTKMSRSPLQVEHISVSWSQAPAWPTLQEEAARPASFAAHSLPQTPLDAEAASEEELELVNAHRRLDEGVIDPITLYDQLRHQMDEQHEEEAKRKSSTPKQRLSLSSWSSGVAASDSSVPSMTKLASPLLKTALSPIGPLTPRPHSRPTSSESNISVDTVKQKGRKDKNAEERQKKTRAGERRSERPRASEESRR